jgi:hypothetical protein
MTDREARAARNQENSLAAFLAKKAEFDALLAEVAQASEDHRGGSVSRYSVSVPITGSPAD